MGKRFLRVLIAAFLVAAAFLVYRWFYSNNEVPGQLQGTGTIEITEVKLAFQVPGRIEAIAVDEGAVVKIGQTLARIDAAELTQNAASSRAAVAALQARLQALQRGARPAEIAQARAALEAAEAQLTAARQNLRRIEPLAEQGVATPSQRDQARTAYDAAVAQRDRVAETLRLVREGARREDITAAQAELNRSQAALELAQTQLAYAAITAPVDGVILVRAAEPGEVVGAGAPVLVEGDLARPWLNVYVSEDKIGRVRLGQTAAVKVDSFPNRSYEARVAYIGDQAEFTPKNVQTKEERVKLVFRVKLEVANPDVTLKPGMPADAIIYTGEDGRG